MTDDEIIDGILDREKEGTPPYLAPNDLGGRTSWGISEVHHPEAWVNGPPTREQARAIYVREYVAPFNTLKLRPYALLRVQLIDWGVLHGYGRTCKWLQKVLGFTKIMRTNRLDAATLDMLEELPLRFVNNALVAARLKLIDQISDADVKQKSNEEGWENRALVFLDLPE